MFFWIISYRTCYLSIRWDTTDRFRQKGEYTRKKEMMLVSTIGRVYPHTSCLPQDSSFPEGRKFASSGVIHYGWAANTSPLPKDIEVCVLHNPLETEYQSHQNLQKVHHWPWWEDFTWIFPYFFQHCLQSYLSIPKGQYLKSEIYRLKWKKKPEFLVYFHSSLLAIKIWIFFNSLAWRQLFTCELKSSINIF